MRQHLDVMMMMMMMMMTNSSSLPVDFLPLLQMWRTRRSGISLRVYSPVLAPRSSCYRLGGTLCCAFTKLATLIVGKWINKPLGKKSTAFHIYMHGALRGPLPSMAVRLVCFAFLGLNPPFCVFSYLVLWA